MKSKLRSSSSNKKGYLGVKGDDEESGTSYMKLDGKTTAHFLLIISTITIPTCIYVCIYMYICRYRYVSIHNSSLPINY